MKRILIAGANSYIGDSVAKRLVREPDNYTVSIKDTIGWKPSTTDFLGIDVVFSVVGIAHIKENKKNKHLFYDINRDLVIAIAKVAKEAGVKQFILLSSMSVYGIITGHITKETPAHPISAYGKSKKEADEEIIKLSDEHFKFCCLRPPMIYGKACKGNYQSLRKFALRFPFFPKFDNQRSMLYIGNLCEFVKECIDEQREGLYFPQNAEYVNTSDMVARIAEIHNKKIWFTKAFNWAVKIAPFGIVKKVFGSLTYEKRDIVSHYNFDQSIKDAEE